jgi:hypothetical protein
MHKARALDTMTINTALRLVFFDHFETDNTMHKGSQLHV